MSFGATGKVLEMPLFWRGFPGPPEPCSERWSQDGVPHFPSRGNANSRAPPPGGAGEKVCTPPGTPSCAFRTPQIGSSGWGARF